MSKQPKPYDKPESTIMTAIERLRVWFKEEDRPETAAWITGDTVETRAILELADRLDKLEAKRPAATESPSEPFKITRPGRYRTRDGRIAKVERCDRSMDDKHPWLGNLGCWNTDGSYQCSEELSPSDLVAGPLPSWWTKEADDGWKRVLAAGKRLSEVTPDDKSLVDEPQQDHEITGLRGFSPIEITGYGSIVPAHSWSRDFDPNDTDRGRCNAWIDWSKVPARAILRPEQKRETRKVWLNIYPSASVTDGYDTRHLANNQANSSRIACVEHEITFTHGEGLEGGQ